MPSRDLREYIDALEKTGDVVKIKQEVDWDLEIGAILRHTCEMRGPACLFERLKDYPPGYRVFGAPVATHRRLAIAMGLDPSTPVRAICDEFEKRLKDPIKPIVVSYGPCKENIIVGDDIDVFRFPVPVANAIKGGRWIGTWAFYVSKDPESDWMNWGMYRGMIHTRKLLVASGNRANHMGYIFYEKYAPFNKPMPVALVIGTDPLSALCSAIRFKQGESEVDFAGALRGEPVELIKCETSDLLVPAHAEIVIEGEILPDSFAPHGPFTEFCGHQTAMQPAREVVRVKAITHRNDPIFTTTNLGIPQGDGAVVRSLGASILYTQLLKERAIPITRVHIPPEASGLVAIVGVGTPHAANVATQIERVIFGQSFLDPTVLFVVDQDVDIYNLHDVLFTFVTRCHPARGISIKDKEVVSRMLPYLDHQEWQFMKGARVTFDCTWPTDWPKEEIPLRISFSDNNAFPKEIREKVLANWKGYGFRSNVKKDGVPYE